MKEYFMVMALCVTGTEAFFGSPLVPTSLRTSPARPHSCARQPCMSGSAFATSRAGKSKTVQEVSELLQKSSLIFSIPPFYMTGNEAVRLRMNMPEGCTARVVKNKLMRIAAKDTDFEKVNEVTTGGNFWMFVEGDDNLAAPIKYIQEFAKDMDPKEKIGWEEPFQAGVFEKELVDGPGVIAISKLPTRQELYQRLAYALKSVPTKLGRSIKLVPTKVGRVVKLAFAEEGEGGDEAGKTPAATEGSAPEGDGDGDKAEDSSTAAEEAPAAE